MVEECFPVKTRRISKNDAPWFNNLTRRHVNKKMRIYKKEGKTERYRLASIKCQEVISEAKKVFVDNIIDKCKKAKNSRGYYKAVKMLNSKEAPIVWHICTMFPGKDENEIAEIVAAFFNAISQEFPPLPNPSRPWNRDMPEIIPIHEIASRLKHFKKPKSQVMGDISPTLVTQFSDILAIPLHFIFNQTLNSLSWPDLWKSETVHVIPKNNSPSCLSELRNLSCTPLYSKVLESFVLDKLKSEVTLSKKQYGGVKGTSTDHFLVDTWNDILTSIETPETAVNLISVDFAKAFNRMHHERCLESLIDLGADIETVDWVASFLHGRHMSVKIGTSFSVPRTVPGGSPQGSILGNFLFCATTDKFTDVTGEEEERNISDNSSSSEDDNSPVPRNYSQPDQDIRSGGLSDTTLSSSEDDSIEFFRVKNRYYFDSTESEPEIDEEMIRLEYSINPKPLSTYVYIDDFNSIETVRLKNMPSHITTRKCHLKVRALKSERLFRRVNELASEIGMQVNTNKTQMLCIHPCIHNEVNTYIEDSGQTVESTEELKILGFFFDKYPSANYHITKVISKFYSKLWT